MKFKSEKFMNSNPELVRIIGDEYLEGSSVTEILNHHPELENKRYRVYDSLDYLGIARRRRPGNYDDDRFTDMVNQTIYANRKN